MRRPTEWPAVRLGLAVQRRASADLLGPKAAALAYYAFLSLFPLLLLALSVLGFLLSANVGVRTEWVERIAELIPGLESLVSRNLDAVVEGRAGTGLLGLIGVTWAGAAVARAAQEALAIIFRTPAPVTVRRQIRRRLRPLAITAALGLLALASVAVTSLAAAAPLPGVAAPLARPLGVALGIALDLGFFLAAYRGLTPPGGPGFREHLPGAVAMTAGWTVLKLGGHLYVATVVARATALYGTVGAVFGLLAVLHIAARLFLYGAELSAVLRERRVGGAGAS